VRTWFESEVRFEWESEVVTRPVSELQERNGGYQGRPGSCALCQNPEARKKRAHGRQGLQGLGVIGYLGGRWYTKVGS
jgi:hypothetical protein